MEKALKGINVVMKNDRRQDTTGRWRGDKGILSKPLKDTKTENRIEIKHIELRDR